MMLAVRSLGSGAGSGNTGDYAQGQLAVRGIDVRVVRTTPVKVFVDVHGVLLNGCTYLGTVEQHRDTHVITVTLSTYSTREVCTMVAQLVDKTIRLDGEFASGSYTVKVNGVVRDFCV